MGSFICLERYVVSNRGEAVELIIDDCSSKLLSPSRLPTTSTSSPTILASSPSLVTTANYKASTWPSEAEWVLLMETKRRILV